MYGKQYLEIEVRIVGSRGEVIELIPWQDFTICPDTNSIRYQHYNKDDCSALEMSFNEILYKNLFSRSMVSYNNNYKAQKKNILIKYLKR